MSKKTNKRLVVITEQEAELIKTFVGGKVKWMRKQGEIEKSILCGPSQFYDIAEVSQSLVDRLRDIFDKPKSSVFPIDSQWLEDNDENR